MDEERGDPALGARTPGMTAAAHQRRSGRRNAPAVRLIFGLAVLVAVGTLLLMLPASGVRQLRVDEALFLAVAALSTTSLSVISPGADLTSFGQFVLLLLMQFGGVGFMSGAVVVFHLIGRRVTLPERLALRDELGLLSSAALLRLFWRVMLGAVAIELVGAILLWLNWRSSFDPGHTAFLALFHSVSAFTSTGFDLFVAPLGTAGAFPTDPGTLLTMGVLVILGSVGIPVLSEVASWPRRRRLSLHSRLTLVTVGALLAGGTLLLFLSEMQGGLSGQPWPSRLLLAFFHSATSRSAGILAQPASSFAPASILVLISLMFIGGSPASMAGGITTSTLSVLVLSIANYVRGRRIVIVQGRSIPQETVMKAAAILTASLSVVVAVTWLLVATQGATLEQALFETVSAFGTCGFSLGLTAHLDLFGRLLVALTMFWGRLGPLTLVVAIAQRGPSAPVTYPEEKILIG